MNLYQVLCCVVSVILTTILVFLISMKSPKGLGYYKYLMIYISSFEAVYSIWDMIVEPICHNFDGAFVVLRDYTESIFSREVGFYVVSVHSGCFGFSMAMFGVHFVYRYGAVDQNFYDKYLSGRKMYSLFLIPEVYSLWWTVIVALFCKFNDETDVYLEETIRENFDVDIRTFSYFVVKFYKNDPNGSSHLNLSAWAVITCMWFMICSSVVCVFFFGIKCYFKITQTSANVNNISDLTKSLQKQLFRALVVQTMIPLLLMYVPICFLFIFPMIRVQLEMSTVFVCYTIATFPAIDPLPNMILIRTYRRAIKEYFYKIFCRPCGISPKQTDTIRSSSSGITKI